jgi:hypothetical protein
MIRDTQRRIIKDRILQDKLKEGFFPSVLLVEQLANEVFQDKPAGVPRFTYRPMLKGKASSSANYNNMFDEIYTDLVVGFEEIKYLNNRMMTLTSYYESTRTKVNREISKMEAKTQAVQMKATAKSNKDVVGDSIDNFLQIDFVGDENRNIPKTDAFINLKQSEVEVMRLRNRTTKLDLTNAKVKFTTETPDLRIINLTPFESALTDTIYDAWRSIVVSPISQKVTTNLLLELDDSITITNLSIDTQTGKPVYITLMLSLDGEEYTTYERRKVVNSYQWVFEAKETKFINFKMEKPEEDRPNGSEYEYLFGAKSIQATEEYYADNSYFVSKPFDLLDHEAIQQVSLEVDEYLPSSTSIRYYIGFDYDTNVIEWQEIRADRPVITEMVKSYSMEINRYTDGYSDFMYESYGQKFHRIAKLPHKPLKKSMTIMIGRNMWVRETIPATVKYDPTNDPSDQVIYQTGIKDWVRVGAAKKDYIRIQNRFDYLQKARFHRYTTNVYIEESDTYRGIFYATSKSTFAVYLNGTQVKGIGQDFYLSMTQGWNKLEVYAYARESNEEMVMDFYVPKMSNRIYASRTPLEQVSLYDMLNNTSSRTHGRFAVDDDNNIIVNYSPRLVDIQNTLNTVVEDNTPVDEQEVRLAEGIEYSLTYQYSVADETHHKLRFMAILATEGDVVKTTPRIKDYRLIVE